MTRLLGMLTALAALMTLSACHDFVSKTRLQIFGTEIPLTKFARHEGLYFEEIDYKSTDDGPLPAMLKVSLVEGRLSISHLSWSCWERQSRCSSRHEGNSIRRVFGNIQTQAAMTDLLFGSSSFPTEWFIGEWPSENAHHYLVFRWTGLSLEYVVGRSGMDFSGRYEVASVEELARKSNYLIKHGYTRKFRVLDAAAGAAKVRQHSFGPMSAAEIRSGKNASAPSQPVANVAPPQGGLAHLEVGALVYVKGILADEAVYVLSVETASNRVQVMRAKDGTEYWVDGASVISRQQAGVNDLVRGTAILTTIVCMAYPDKCKR